MVDRIVRGILRTPNLLVVAAVGTGMAREARKRHGLAPSSAALLGEALTAASLIAALQKAEKTRINLQLECDGPARGLFVDADTQGRARGYVKAKAVRFAPAPRFDPEPLLGTTGYVSVLRDVDGVFYRGSVGLEYRDLSRDLEHYYLTSEQTETALQLEALADGDEELGWVGGVLVQRLPDGDEDALKMVRAQLRAGVEQAVRAGATTPEALLKALFPHEPLEAEGAQDLTYFCQCTRERVLRALQTLPNADLFEMIHKDKGGEVDCDFCGQHYAITPAELQEVLDLVDRTDAEAELAKQATKRETVH
jgi:molecular chaperone Hsp33